MVLYGCAMNERRQSDGGNRRDFYGIAEVADALGLDRQLVTVWRKRRSHSMPEPDAELASGPLWRGETVEPWIDRMRQPVGPATPAPIPPSTVRRVARRLFRLQALLLEDVLRPRLIAQAIAEVRDLVPLIEDSHPSDPLRPALLDVLGPVVRAAPGAEDRGDLISELLGVQSAIVELVASAVRRESAGPRRD